MRKIKKINGYLIVKFNDREKRVYEGTALGEYGIIEAELYTGRLDADRDTMKCDTAGTLEEAVELARSLETEMDLTDEPATYTILVENGDKVSEKEVEPRRMVDTEQSKLEGQAKSRFCPEVDECSAAHQLYGYKSALCDLGLLHEDERFVSPATFGGCGIPGSLPNDPEELLSYICDTVCGQRLPGRTQEELDAVCAKCAVQKLAQAAVFDTAVHPRPQEKTNFKNLDPKLRNDPLIPKLYQLGFMLEDDCPDNDCMIYRSTFRLAQELDTAMDSISGYPAFVLRRDLRGQIRYLLKMYLENSAVKQYLEEMDGRGSGDKEPVERLPKENAGASVGQMTHNEETFLMELAENIEAERKRRNMNREILKAITRQNLLVFAHPPLIRDMPSTKPRIYVRLKGQANEKTEQKRKRF